jgi:two-component system, OmpR family, response regulator QseB
MLGVDGPLTRRHFFCLSKHYMRILLLEDDLQLGKALQAALAQSEYKSIWVRRVVDAQALLKSEAFAAVLLDIGLPDGSGLDVLTALRAEGKSIPVIMLTARDAVSDRVRGLDAGADDYLAKPFAVPELLSRIRAVTRRSAGFAEVVWRVGTLSIDPTRHRAMIAGTALDLSLREYTLLVELVRSAGKYVTRTRLEQVLFGLNAQLESNALEVHIHNLRKKLGAITIKTIRGVGYLLEDGT